MERASNTGSISLQQLDTINSLLQEGNEVTITFNSKGTTITAVKVLSTPGLKLSDQEPGVSGPRKIPLELRKAEIAAEKDTVTVREKVFKKLKSAKNSLLGKFKSKFHKATDDLKQSDTSVSAKVKNSFNEMKKAIKHENWEKIPEESMMGGSEQLKLEAQAHNDRIVKLESAEKQEVNKQTELDKLKELYKDTIKVCENPDEAIHSKKRITLQIPIEDADPVIIASTDPVARNDLVNMVIKQVGNSGLFSRMEQLGSEIKQLKSEQKQLKSSIKDSGKEILKHFKEQQHTLEQGKGRNTRLSELQDTLTQQRIKLDDRVDQLQAEIRALKTEKQQAQESVAEQKKLLSDLKKELSLLSKIPKEREGIPEAYSGTVNRIQKAQESIEIGSARLKAIPGEMKEKKAELDTKMKEVESLQKGKELKQQEKADKRDIEAEQNMLKQQLGKKLRKK
ncbi:hypothetical protein [Endozoicomonas sp. GU-1]|uniref:hypothetical protein n=1 Tax=Endozoicomonas sp. GU-1 TaxID=3009078 RepID=UPI0022B49842|nr:hypothetical protein [Endozoicomonas sp. GU-1]WBA83080.1 hypothetical protein O2T12_08180 [Endozoicomonas sp. GU-1]WBA86004.1 hypothetical protein O3276_22815 [Endozoicomonas sp. GU-1]